MKELTLRAVLLGLVMTVVLGAANAYLGLHAGQTIAATYPAAVIGMAFLRAFKGTVLEENIARTAGSIGESVAAGAIFTIPAFVMSGSWTSFDPAQAYWKSTALMLVGSVLGVLFVSLVRRALVEDASDLADSLRYFIWNHNNRRQARTHTHVSCARARELATFAYFSRTVRSALSFNSNNKTIQAEHRCIARCLPPLAIKSAWLRKRDGRSREQPNRSERSQRQVGSGSRQRREHGGRR